MNDSPHVATESETKFPSRGSNHVHELVRNEKRENNIYVFMRQARRENWDGMKGWDDFHDEIELKFRSRRLYLLALIDLLYRGEAIRSNAITMFDQKGGTKESLRCARAGEQVNILPCAENEKRSSTKSASHKFSAASRTVYLGLAN